MMKRARSSDCFAHRAFARCARQRYQRGDMLLEALIGAVLMLAIGLGLTYSAARMVQAQRDTNVHSLALQAVRNQLQTASNLKVFCDNPTASMYVKAQGRQKTQGTQETNNKVEHKLSLSCSLNLSASVQVSVGDGSQSGLTATVSGVPSGLQLTATAPETLGSAELLTIRQ